MKRHYYGKKKNHYWYNLVNFVYFSVKSPNSSTIGGHYSINAKVVIVLHVHPRQTKTKQPMCFSPAPLPSPAPATGICSQDSCRGFLTDLSRFPPAPRKSDPFTSSAFFSIPV